MYRRCLCLLLATQLLLVQGLMRYGHADDHDGHHSGRSPHIHLRHLPFAPASTHHHPHEEPEPCDEGAPAGDHDADAIDLPDLVTDSPPSFRLSPCWGECHVLSLTLPVAAGALFVAAEYRPPGALHRVAGHASCPVYLQTLALLI